MDHISHISHISHQDALLEELLRHIVRCRKLSKDTDVMLYINSHLQGLINLVDEITERVLLGQEELTPGERQEVLDNLEMRRKLVKLAPLFVLLNT